MADWKPPPSHPMKRREVNLRLHRVIEVCECDSSTRIHDNARCDFCMVAGFHAATFATRFGVKRNVR